MRLYPALEYKAISPYALTRSTFALTSLIGRRQSLIRPSKEPSGHIIALRPSRLLEVIGTLELVEEAALPESGDHVDERRLLRLRKRELG